MEDSQHYGKENRMKSIKYMTLGLLLAALFIVSAIPAHGISGLAHSSNVLVLNTQGDASGVPYAGEFPTTAVTAAGYSVSFLASGSVTGASSFSGYDTIVLWMYCAVGSDTTVQNALVSFLQSGGKIIIWDSDACNSEEGTQATYSWLGSVGATFAAQTPGETGSTGGSLTIVENDGFVGSLTQTNLNNLATSTDAVGDMNVITSNSPAWCAILSGTNISPATGLAQAYTAPGALTGATGAIIVYTGMDTDYIGESVGTTGGDIEVSMIVNQLAHGWGNSAYTSDLTCGVPVSGIKLGPLTATNAVGGTHTVTATVTSTSTGLPVSGVTVTFDVTAGPNMGATGTAVTGASGTATFTYTDTGGAGTDTIVASFTPVGAGAVYSNTVEKIWSTSSTTTTTSSSSSGGTPPIGAPEFAGPSILVVAITLLGLAFLAKKKSSLSSKAS